jgi:hypothetical protein
MKRSKKFYQGRMRKLEGEDFRSCEVERKITRGFSQMQAFNTNDLRYFF